MPNYGAPSSELAGLVSSGNAPLFVAQVAAVNEDGTVSLAWGADPVLGVACSSAYLKRDVGQSVIVGRVSGDLIVLGTTAQAEIDLDSLIAAAINPVADDVDAVTKHANDLDDLVHFVDNVRPRVTYGAANAPTGFVQASSVWFKEMGGGRVDLYVKTTSGTSSSETTKPSTSKTTTHPRPVTLTPAGAGSWRDGGQTDPSRVLQGDWTGRGDWRGGWFNYSDSQGRSIQQVCALGTVSSIAFYVGRTDDGSGWGRGVPAHISLHNQATKAKPSMSSLGSHAVKLAPGQAAKWLLPSDWRAALASGAQKGFMLSGSGRGDYMKATKSAGKIVVSF